MPVVMPPYALRLLAGQRKGALDGSRITSIVAPGGVCASSRFRVPLPSRVARTCRIEGGYARLDLPRWVRGSADVRVCS